MRNPSAIITSLNPINKLKNNFYDTINANRGGWEVDNLVLAHYELCLRHLSRRGMLYPCEKVYDNTPL